MTAVTSAAAADTTTTPRTVWSYDPDLAVAVGAAVHALVMAELDERFHGAEAISRLGPGSPDETLDDRRARRATLRQARQAAEHQLELLVYGGTS